MLEMLLVAQFGLLSILAFAAGDAFWIKFVFVVAVF